jgi:phosphate transport system ATP-binding protein
MSVSAAERRAPTLTTERLSAWFGQRRVVNAVTMECPAQRVTAIVGPSGCGKSTLLRCFNRLHETMPSARIEGAVRLDGADMYADDRDPIAVRRRVGMVFQRATPFPHWSIKQNLLAAAPKLSFDESEERVRSALERTALWKEVGDRLSASALALSLGQQQRLCIARALLASPDMLLLDEPTAALDPVSTQRLEELIYELRSDLTVVIVTHNMQQAARVSDQTVFMLAGEVVESGPTERLFTRPNDPRTEAYVTGRFG